MGTSTPPTSCSRCASFSPDAILRPIMPRILRGQHELCGFSFAHPEVVHLKFQGSRKVISVQASGVVENAPGNPPPPIVNGRPGVDHVQKAINELNTTIKLTDFGMSTRMDTKCRCDSCQLLRPLSTPFVRNL